MKRTLLLYIVLGGLLLSFNVSARELDLSSFLLRESEMLDIESIYPFQEPNYLQSFQYQTPRDPRPSVGEDFSSDEYEQYREEYKERRKQGARDYLLDVVTEEESKLGKHQSQATRIIANIIFAPLLLVEYLF